MKINYKIAIITVIVILLTSLAIVNIVSGDKKDHVTKEANHLINSTSPYLLQHAYNPVNWYPWGEEALQKARKENKPILLSIGYSTCYWCHVMEKEVFENLAIAKIMNDSVISIKIDREERPDLDEIYMTATQIITGSGGWPNNVFVTPDLKPFYAGTYFPAKDSIFGKPGFSTVIKKISKNWAENQGKIESQANKLTNQIAGLQKEQINFSNQLPTSQVADSLFSHFSDYYDEQRGGFYLAPKFPNEVALLFLLDIYKIENNGTALNMAKNTLGKMAQGGIYDSVGGGFHRYSTDSMWLIPHFEKMLYNQALLGSAYTKLYEVSSSKATKNVASGIYDYVLKSLTDENGGFYCALDAHTDGAEGAYYAWEDLELEEALSTADLKWLKKHYALANIPDISGHKNADGEILYLKKPLQEKDLVQNTSIMSTLEKSRSKRKLPHLDDKIMAAWNGLMINSLAKAGMILGEPKYIAAAKKSADFILTNMRNKDGELYRIWREGKTSSKAFFEDYSFMIQGLAQIYKATGEEKYLTQAKSLVEKSKELFLDKSSGGYFFTDGSEKLLVRMKNAQDSAIPSGNSVMAHALLDLYIITKDEKWKTQAGNILKSFAISMQQNPRAYTHMTHALLRYEHINEEMNESRVLNQNSSKSSSGTSLTQTKSRVKVLLEKVSTGKIAITLNIADGWHINSNKPTLDSLIPTSVDVRGGDEITINSVNYPKAQNITTPLGQVDVYGGKIIVPVDFTSNGGDENLRVVIRAQACKDSRCLSPSDWVIEVD